MNTLLAEPWPCTHDEYHADDAVGCSMLKEFARSRTRYYARYVAKTLPPKAPTPAMQLGTLVHLLALEPERADSIAVAPKCDRRTKAGKADWEAFCAESEGKTIVDSDQLNTARLMVAALMAHDAAGPMLRAPGEVEHGLRWQDPETMLTCKARPDKRIRVGNGHALVDLKTCSDSSPEGFGSAVARQRYHWQDHWYRQGHRAVYGELPRFIFVAVESTPPFDVACYELTEGDRSDAQQQVLVKLNQLANCIESDEWRNEHGTGICQLLMPAWAKNLTQWEMD